MEIILIDKVSKRKTLGSSKNIPIPREGEKINLGYEPYAKVIEIVYDYYQEKIFVIVDGFILP